MPQPKRRHSRGRRNNRRSHDSLKPPGLSVCTECNRHIRPHVVCPHCGHYKGKKVLDVDNP